MWNVQKGDTVYYNGIDYKIQAFYPEGTVLLTSDHAQISGIKSETNIPVEDLALQVNLEQSPISLETSVYFKKTLYTVVAFHRNGNVTLYSDKIISGSTTEYNIPLKKLSLADENITDKSVLKIKDTVYYEGKMQYIVGLYLDQQHVTLKDTSGNITPEVNVEDISISKNFAEISFSLNQDIYYKNRWYKIFGFYLNKQEVTLKNPLDGSIKQKVKLSHLAK